ncbi:MAG: 30S ribosomal protein S17 [Cellvibrionales bacterium TMED148]|nr:30S ribosomal protein S17 [Porticoccaceae bacterium]RPG92109.1 MAG: 30S ribosomal protein S17 [Cellvibrionales bacterium TMED148]|tara:strand:+ start:280 stop:543 length:264 start_codon:yes stop_codon:yes gene_type:complete
MAAVTKKTRSLAGRVVSDKMSKTATVLVERRVKHQMYGKILTRSSKIKVHDEKNEAKIGDLVTISEGKPKSKSKSWILLSVDERAAV